MRVPCSAGGCPYAKAARRGHTLLRSLTGRRLSGLSVVTALHEEKREGRGKSCPSACIMELLYASYILLCACLCKTAVSEGQLYVCLARGVEGNLPSPVCLQEEGRRFLSISSLWREQPSPAEYLRASRTARWCRRYGFVISWKNMLKALLSSDYWCEYLDMLNLFCCARMGLPSPLQPVKTYFITALIYITIM